MMEHSAEWYQWVLVSALRYNPKIGKLIDLDSIEEMIEDLVQAVKEEATAKLLPTRNQTYA